MDFFVKYYLENQILKGEQFRFNLLCICQLKPYMKIVLRLTIFRFKKNAKGPVTYTNTV